MATNFVPAQNYKNREFYNQIEGEAAGKFGNSDANDNPKRPGDYKVDLALYEGPATGYPGGSTYPDWFPRRITATYRTHTYKGTGSGSSRSDWNASSWRSPETVNFDPPPKRRSAIVRLNTVNLGNPTEAARVRPLLGNHGITFIAVGKLRPFADIADMKAKLSAYKHVSGKGIYDFEKKVWPQIEANYNSGLFTL